jgi:hypothetical protein
MSELSFVSSIQGTNIQGTSEVFNANADHKVFVDRIPNVSEMFNITNGEVVSVGSTNKAEEVVDTPTEYSDGTEKNKRVGLAVIIILGAALVFLFLRRK